MHLCLSQTLYYWYSKNLHNGLIYISIVVKLQKKKKKFSIKNFFNKPDQNLRKLQIWPHLLKKFLMENLISYAV